MSPTSSYVASALHQGKVRGNGNGWYSSPRGKFLRIIHKEHSLLTTKMPLCLSRAKMLRTSVAKCLGRNVGKRLWRSLKLTYPASRCSAEISRGGVGHLECLTLSFSSSQEAAVYGEQAKPLVEIACGTEGQSIVHHTVLFVSRCEEVSQL